VLPSALSKRPSTTYTQALIADAKSKVPRLRELTEVQLRNFLIDEESVGVPCEKFRSAIGNGWTFPPLAEAREAWERRYGPVAWDFADAKHWGDKEGKKGVEGSGDKAVGNGLLESFSKNASCITFLLLSRR
jgi:hypothetical protein